ncbi:MAG TPA: cytochrome c [Chitinophagaceae bacterium]|jgi:mono/diheme cytochrome c family protein|nr:cytochrome c [Chitinophagaceae bacterium]
MNQIKYPAIAGLIVLIGLLLFLFLQSLRSGAPSPAEAPLPPPAAQPAPAAYTPPANGPDGKKIFQQNCQSCHAINKNLTGPALAGVTGRGPWTERENLYKWIHNPAAYIPTDPYTVALQKQYNGQIMPAFPQLTNEQIDALMNYLDRSL